MGDVDEMDRILEGTDVAQSDMPSRNSCGQNEEESDYINGNV
jgi:hypothetical protein